MATCLHNRRSSALAVLTALTLAAVACGSPDSSAKNSPAEESVVVYAGTGGETEKAMYKAWFDEFTKETGIKVVEDAPGVALYPKLTEMARQKSVTWDVVQTTPSNGAVDNPLLAGIDCAVTSCADFKDAPFKLYPQAVPLLTYANVLVYNTKAFPDKSKAPTGVGDFFKPDRFPGKRVPTVPQYGWPYFLPATLIASGVPRDQVYPIDYDRAFTFLDKIKDDLIVPSTHANCVTDVGAGEAAIALCTSGRAALAKAQGLPIELAWGRQLLGADYVMIPKDAPHPENAQKLVAFITSKQHNAKLAEHIGFGPTNPLSAIAPDAAFADAVPAAHMLPGDDAPITMNFDYWTPETIQKSVEKISSWLQGK